MYKKYKTAGNIIAAERALARLRSLGVCDEEIQNLKEDWEDHG